jgi:hypothetical protein
MMANWDYVKGVVVGSGGELLALLALLWKWMSRDEPTPCDSGSQQTKRARIRSWLFSYQAAGDGPSEVIHSSGKAE